MADSILARVKLITGATDPELAELVGLNLSTARAYMSGRRVEYLNLVQLAALRDFVSRYREAVEKAAGEFALFT